MPYRLEQVSRKEAKRINKFKREATVSFHKLQEYGLAAKRHRDNQKENLSFAIRNREAAERAHQITLDFIKMQYAWCRSKIQNPNTPAEGKRAYRKVAKMLEVHFGHRWLVTDNPAFRKTGDNIQGRLTKEAYQLCWVRPREP
jgi:hypothetical protein